MKKIILIFILTFILVSCSEYEYDIDYTLCNNSGTGNVKVIYNPDLYSDPYISTYKEAVPVLNLGNKGRILNVCYFNVKIKNNYIER